MKLKINENWFIDNSGEGATLHFEEIRIRKDGKEKGQEYLFKDVFYRRDVQDALQAYLLKSLEDFNEVKDCLNKIDLAMKEIKNLSF